MKFDVCSKIRAAWLTLIVSLSSLGTLPFLPIVLRVVVESQILIHACAHLLCDPVKAGNKRKTESLIQGMVWKSYAVLTNCVWLSTHIPFIDYAQDSCRDQ